MEENFVAVKVAFGKALEANQDVPCKVSDAEAKDASTEAISISISTLLVFNCAGSKLILPLNFLKEPEIIELSCATLNSILLLAGIIFHAGARSAAFAIVIEKEGWQKL